VTTDGPPPGAERPLPSQPGPEPDYRFTLANERTYLAWIRTALALVGAGIAVIRLLPPLPVPGAREVVGAALVLLGALVAANSHRRWRRVEQAIRTAVPLPRMLLPAVLAGTVAVASFLVLVLLLLEGRS
jgi:putative membrane protein